ncbi:MAG: type II secretion system F family protein [Clostridia bacterium]|nr:type II secretion system F family protein [Clostridia bacterium]
MLMFLCMAVASLLLVVFAYLFLTSGAENERHLRNSLYNNQIDTIKTSKIEYSLIKAKLQENENAVAGMRHEPDPRLVKRAKKLQKLVAQAQKSAKSYKKNGVGILDMAPLAGYRVMDIRKIDNDNSALSGLYQKCLHFKNNDEAMSHAKYLMASLIGNLLLGAVVLFLGIGFGLALGMGTKSLIIGLVLFAVFALLGYVPYDAVNVTVRQRADSIEHDFPRVVSKLTLLTVSGMEVSQAWDLVSMSDTGTLYAEMRRVTIDMENNTSPVAAFKNFIKRCDYSYTTKLGTAMMQSTIRGNTEIVALLRGLNTESWSEYKHSARRKGEQIATKLLIPTLLLFAGILILIIVPAMSGFNF